MTPESIATIILAAIGVLSVGGAFLAWVARRGGREKGFSVALDRNTFATEKLTDKLDGVVQTLHDHDIRLTRLEVAPHPIHVTTHVEAPQDDRTPAHRDAGTEG